MNKPKPISDPAVKVLSWLLERIRDSVQAMQVLLADPDRNAPRPISDFPLPEPERRRGCPYCPFYALCHEELEEADFAKWSSASPA